MLKFRNIKYDDLDMIRAWRTSQDVATHMYTDTSLTREDQIRWFESLQTNKAVIYRVICWNDIPIGMASLTNIDYNSKHSQWGLYIGETKYQLRGAGAIATYKFINYAFHDVGLNKLMSMVLVTNKNSIKLAESFGFDRYGYYRNHCYKNGNYIDMIGFEILKKDWIKLNEYFKTKFKP